MDISNTSDIYGSSHPFLETLPPDIEKKAQDIVQKLDGQFATLQIGDADIEKAHQISTQNKSGENGWIGEAVQLSKRTSEQPLDQVNIQQDKDRLLKVFHSREPHGILSSIMGPRDDPYTILTKSNRRYVFFSGASQQAFKAAPFEKHFLGKLMGMPLIEKALGNDFPLKLRLFANFHEHTHVGDKILAGYFKNGPLSEKAVLASECRADWSAISCYHNVTGDVNFIRNYARFRHVEMFVGNGCDHATQYVLQKWLQQKDPSLSLPPFIPSKEIEGALKTLNACLEKNAPDLFKEKGMTFSAKKVGANSLKYRRDLLKIIPDCLERGLIPEGFSRDMAIGINEAYSYFNNKNREFIMTRKLSPPHAQFDIPQADYGQLKQEAARATMAASAPEEKPRMTARQTRRDMDNDSRAVPRTLMQPTIMGS